MALELLFPHFDELIRTPEDVQWLNAAILQLAVQGKLVPQDLEDEPASELLKRIEAERAHLFEAQMTGMAYPAISDSKLHEGLFPLPPFAEQHRIVAKVDELFAQTRALEARLRQAQADVVTANRAALHRLHTAQDEDQFRAAWRTLRDHFDVLYDDPRNVAELRQAILDLAVRGKLVAQDPGDEPAGELLTEIDTESKQAVTEERIEKADPPPSIKAPQQLPALPHSWHWTYLDTVPPRY